MFKRPDAISGDNSNNTPTNLQQQQQNYFCINSGNVQNIDGNIGRLDDENPLKFSILKIKKKFFFFKEKWK